MHLRTLPPDFPHSQRSALAIVLSGVFLVLTAEAGVSRTPIRLAIAEFRPVAPRSSVALNSSKPTLTFDPYINAASREHGVSHELIRAIIQTESEFDPRAVSSRGACGLMQLMPGTLRRFGRSTFPMDRASCRGATGLPSQNPLFPTPFWGTAN